MEQRIRAMRAESFSVREIARELGLSRLKVHRVLLVAALTAQGNAAPMRVPAIVACVVGAIAALGLALLTFMDVSMYGFPDGHVTDYEKAVDAPLTNLAWVEAGVGFLFLALAFTPIGTRARVVGLLVALIAFVLVATVAQVVVPWYFGTHLGLDNGIGG